MLTPREVSPWELIGFHSSKDVSVLDTAPEISSDHVDSDQSSGLEPLLRRELSGIFRPAWQCVYTELLVRCRRYREWPECPWQRPEFGALWSRRTGVTVSEWGQRGRPVGDCRCIGYSKATTGMSSVVRSRRKSEPVDLMATATALGRHFIFPYIRAPPKQFIFLLPF